MLLSEFISLILFLASVGVYARKAGRNTVVYRHAGGARHFIVLNITLYASDYFTGDGINDAVLYTLTNSLTGAGVGKYILPGLGLIVALVTIFGALAGCCAAVAIFLTIMATACWRFLALASVDASPRVSSDHRACKIPVARRRSGLRGLL